MIARILKALEMRVKGVAKCRPSVRAFAYKRRDYCSTIYFPEKVLIRRGVYIAPSRAPARTRYILLDGRHGGTQKPCASGDKGNGLNGTFSKRGGDRNYEGTAFPRGYKEHPRIQRYE